MHRQNQFKAGQHPQAIARYSTALQLVTQRPPWEASALGREEYSTILSNRSAAYYEAGDWINALVDAEAVIQIRKNWSKGYFRKAKVLLQLHSYQEAKETLELGLSFEAENHVRTLFLVRVSTLTCACRRCFLYLLQQRASCALLKQRKSRRFLHDLRSSVSVFTIPPSFPSHPVYLFV